MVPLWLLPAMALFTLLCAFLLAKARRLSRHRIFWDGTAAVTAAVASTIPGICCYAFSAGSASTLARDSGGACFLAFPIVGAAALQVNSRRFGFPPGSLVGAFLLGIFALAVIAAWAILYLKGPRGGWSAVEVIVSAASVILTYSAATCFGWWCRSMRQANA
jgi:peptidoglycan/LPS O-acetylase OafA/YrhL